MKKYLIFILAIGTLLFAETHIPGGEIFGVWTAEGSPYYIDGEVHIPTDSMLVIEPGCLIIFTDNYRFCVDSNAVLKARGREGDSIVFTAQDTLEGYLGILFRYAAEGCTLSYCIIEYGVGDVGVAGIFCSHSSPIIMHNRISRNYGGIACYYSNPQIEGNVITKNRPVISDGAGIWCYYSSPKIKNNIIGLNGYFSIEYGGGIYCEHSDPIIENNIISGNTARNGAGIYCIESSPMIINNTISGNSADWDVFYGYGGGIFCAHSNLTIANNRILGNIAEEGGGILCSDSSNVIIENNIIAWNSADGGLDYVGYGGGILCEGSNLMIINNTISENWGRIYSYGGGILCSSCRLTIFNTILWQKYAVSWGGEIDIGDCTLFVAYTNIDTSGCYIRGESEIIWGPGIINSDPLFADTLFHLSDSSPCIDAGAESVYVPI